MTERRERMMAGEEAYLLPRDRGPVRRYVRDVVDSRRNLLGLFMPSALTLLFVMFAVPQVQFYLSPAMLILLALMTIDAIILVAKLAGWLTRSSRLTPKAGGGWVFTPPAELPRYAGCGRPDPKSSAAAMLANGRRKSSHPVYTLVLSGRTEPIKPAKG